MSAERLVTRSTSNEVVVAALGERTNFDIQCAVKKRTPVSYDELFSRNDEAKTVTWTAETNGLYSITETSSSSHRADNLFDIVSDRKFCM
jgi:hypothetical protein